MLGGGSAVLHQGPAKWAMRSTRAIRGPPLRENDGCTVIRTMIVRSIEAFQSLFSSRITNLQIRTVVLDEF
jgi:hypothetical protein